MVFGIDGQERSASVISADIAFKSEVAAEVVSSSGIPTVLADIAAQVCITYIQVAGTAAPIRCLGKSGSYEHRGQGKDECKLSHEISFQILASGKGTARRTCIGAC